MCCFQINVTFCLASKPQNKRMALPSNHTAFWSGILCEQMDRRRHIPNKKCLCQSAEDKTIDQQNLKVQCHVNKGSPIIPILSRINPNPRIDTYFFKIHYNIVLHSFSYYFIRLWINNKNNNNNNNDKLSLGNDSNRYKSKFTTMEEACKWQRRV